MASNDFSADPEAPPTERRAFLSSVSSLAMAGGLAAASGAFAFMGRLLDSAEAAGDVETGWLPVIDVAGVGEDGSLSFRTPSGLRVVIARRGRDDTAASFVAVSGTCPHLGGRVQWESRHDRFVCPCPDGTFDPTGNATGGSKAAPLTRYVLTVVDGQLHIELPATEVALGPGAVIPPPRRTGPGHDPCLDGTRRVSPPAPVTPPPARTDATPRKGTHHETT